MELKPASAPRASQFAGRQAATNSKNKQPQDAVTASKGQQRGGRGRRDGSVPQLLQQQQQQAAAKRGKAHDKRPRPRGQYHEGGKEDSQVGDHAAEFESVLSGRKKVNLNHLLNFHYGPNVGTVGVGSPPGYKNWQHAPQRHRFNKEQFLQANCQFVVKSGADYSRYLNDPDTLVQWDAIEQIRIHSSEKLSCPICLYQPKAARITKCGHIFCWPCVLHYLALGEKSWRKCPICYESIYKDDLKSVIALHHEDLKPVENQVQSGEEPVDPQQCKLVKASPLEILAILQQETDELKERLLEEQGDPEICFTEQAFDLLEQRKSFVSSNVSLVEEEAVAADVENCNYLDESAKVPKNESLSEETKKTFYFYQADDGQHVYLHALNVHMIEHTHGELEHCPTTIRGRIVEKEAVSMSSELRQRLRCLQHLPLTCQFEVVELELRPPAVSRPTLHHFREQLEARRKQRQRRAREENKLAKRISEEENRLLGKFPLPSASIESYQHFPECGGGVGHTASAAEQPLEEIMQELTVDPSNSYTGPSFSRMLQEGKGHGPPARAPKMSTSCSAPNFPTLAAPTEEDTEACLPAPSFSKSFGDAFAMALMKAENSNGDGPEDEGQGRKKKKNKKKLLFSTSMACNSK
ncbi:Hypothetical predicted protein [Cloeon dipterum]|uniref:E3 ubiquitin-protein ligase RNF10 n=1 Tax=Cloeon dipterum TaxID=197152 RepID=A0A8S1CYP8_9INSE|nr:Hypothetical predicted protein [Cloeon dipterum]